MTADYDIAPEDMATQIQAAGVAGAGGAGFPAYGKWQDPSSVDFLLVNHQESEPPYYTDKWLGGEHADKLAGFLDGLLEAVFDVVVIGTKEKYRDEWMRPLEVATGGTPYLDDSLPITVADESGTVFAYTPDIYTYSEEKVLLMISAGVQIGEDLPTEHGWIVHNTETLYNVMRAVRDGTPVTRKFVHVDGNTPRHRCLDVPVGTPATTLLEAAGLQDGRPPAGTVLADGGPGWCYEIAESADAFGVRKRTNGLLVLEETLAAENVQADGQIDVLTERDWDRVHETEPDRLEPDEVRIPLITNAAYEGLVAPSVPSVQTGDRVTVGDQIAKPGAGPFSNPQHASIDGRVTEITEIQIVIETTD